MIDDPSAFENLVSDQEWKILGADEPNESKLQKLKHEKWLTSQNMALPPKSKKKKKRTKAKTPSDLGGAASSSETESDIEDDEEQDAIDKAISRKFPDFK